MNHSLTLFERVFPYPRSVQATVQGNLARGTERKYALKRRGVFWGVLGGNKGRGKATRPVRGIVNDWENLLGIERI